MTKDILFNNSNVLYDLRYQPVFDETLQEDPKQLTYNTKPPAESKYSSPNIPPIPPAGSTHRPSTSGPVDPRSGSLYEPPLFPPPPKFPQVYEVQLLDEFMKQNPDTKFVYVQWLDYMATTRVRIVPIKEFTRIIHEGDRIGISQGNTGTLQNDTLTPVVNTTGQIYVEPDLRSLRRSYNKDPLKAATVLSYWRDEPGNPIPSCPRTSLVTLIDLLQHAHATTLLVGFEIEVTFVKLNPHSTSTSTTNSTNSFSTSTSNAYIPLSTTHAWSTLPSSTHLPFLSDVLEALEESAITIQQFHAESGPGQFEFILPPNPPLLAVDTLILARQTISQIATLHGYRATLHPKPTSSGVGNAAHAHISLHPPDRDIAFFVGGVLAHLPALCAFTLPNEASYARVVDDAWTGGKWVAWGTQNREVPLRRIRHGLFEIRCIDGLANPYFALAAIIAAGLLGLQAGEQIYQELDLPVNPAQLDDEQRAHYGVVRKLPASFGEAVEALKGDAGLREVLDQRLVGDYLVMKEAEAKMLEGMGEVEGRRFLVERY